MQFCSKFSQWLLVIGFLFGNISVALADQAQPRNISLDAVESELGIDAMAMQEELQALVDKWGLEVENFSVSVSVSDRKDGENGLNSGGCEGCTITATISIPGGTGIEISATAETCAGAWDKISDFASEIGAEIIQ